MSFHQQTAGIALKFALLAVFMVLVASTAPDAASGNPTNSGDALGIGLGAAAVAALIGWHGAAGYGRSRVVALTATTIGLLVLTGTLCWWLIRFLREFS